MTEPLDAAGFRDLFPALRRHTWLDTPGSPPAARPVSEVLRRTLDDWDAGEFDWLAWDRTPLGVRTLFASFLGVPDDTVALVGSVSEAAATVAAALPAGRIVVGDSEFRSNLYPWLQAQAGGREVVRVAPRDGALRTEDLVAALDGQTALLAVSEVLSSDGVRADLPELRAATDRTGARLFVDASQSLGALHLDVHAVRPDYLAVHGYKWMLCPRGAAWLVVREDRLAELEPLAPGWKSTEAPHGYFGGDLTLPRSAARLDASPAWFSWIGAEAALRLHARLDRRAVEEHCVGLASAFLAEAEKVGCVPVARGLPSQIVTVRVPDADRVHRKLAEQRIKCSLLGDRLRLGFHYFNDLGDVERVLAALSAG